jgi:hypothetical protein
VASGGGGDPSVRGKEDAWMALAGDLDEASTLNPTTAHDRALQIAALTVGAVYKLSPVDP